MLFSKLIEILQKGESEVLSYNISNNPEIISGASLEKASKNQISFLENDSYLLSELDQTKCSALILPNQQELSKKTSAKKIAWVIVNDPRVAFAEVLDLIAPEEKFIDGIHKSAVIEKNVYIGSGVSIGANVYIGSDSTIGDKTIIHPGVVIYKRVSIGKNNELHANCVIHSHSKLGEASSQINGIGIHAEAFRSVDL